MTPPEMHTAIPVLLSLDIPATVGFYTSTLGFTCRYHEEGFAILQRDAIELHFTGCPEQHLVDWSSCRVGVTGIDELYAEYAQRGILHPNSKLHDTHYGTREFGIVDPQGVLITFSERQSNAA